MYYEINVARYGLHYFATAPRSLTSAIDANEVFAMLRDSLPLNKGFTITMTQWNTVGTPISGPVNI